MSNIYEIVPKRVLVNAEGEAISFEQAKVRNLIDSIYVVLLRNDGWTIGATEELEDVAWRLWAGEWEGWWQRDVDGEFIFRGAESLNPRSLK